MSVNKGWFSINFLSFSALMWVNNVYDIIFELPPIVENSSRYILVHSKLLTLQLRPHIVPFIHSYIYGKLDRLSGPKMT